MAHKIVFTGGGTAGHVTPNIALAQQLRTEIPTLQCLYIGSRHGIETQLTHEFQRYFAISTGKLRRYRSWRNWLSPWQVLAGILQALCILLWHRPQFVFSKGGFVAFPVVFAAWLLRIPTLIHESDLTPGLANRLCYPFAHTIFTSFANTLIHPRFQHKQKHTSTPIRPALQQGCPHHARKVTQFTTEKPCLLVTGGSLGAERLNQFIHQWVRQYDDIQIIHLCGQGNLNPELNHLPHYFQREYAHEEMGDLLSIADAVISRAGANSIREWLALQLPHVLIPLSTAASRGDQIDNARYYQQQGTALVRQENNLTLEDLRHDCQQLLHSPQPWIDRIQTWNKQQPSISLPQTLLQQLQPH